MPNFRQHHIQGWMPTKGRPYRKTRWTTRNRPRQYRSKSPLQELKFQDVVISDAVVSATGQVQTSVNLVVQGTGEEQRIGRRIILRSLACRFQIRLPVQDDVGNLSGGDTLRIIIFQDRQANGADAAVLDILETATYDSFRNLATKGRFRILKEKWITMNRVVSTVDGTNTASTPVMFREWRFYMKLNIPIDFTGTTGAIDVVSSNNIAYLYISSAGIIGVSQQCTRIRYDG